VNLVKRKENMFRRKIRKFLNHLVWRTKLEFVVLESKEHLEKHILVNKYHYPYDVKMMKMILSI
jgi:hypothetical protein